MKAFGKKALALAVFGLVGYGMAGAAFGQTCTDTNLSAWPGGTAALGGGTVHVVSGGLDGSACAMSATLGTGGSDQATVLDTSPQNEQRYRFQFLFNPTALGPIGASDSVNLFSAINATAVNGRRGIIAVNLVPAAGGATRMTLLYSCNTPPLYRCIATTSNLAAGVNRVEFDVQMGTTTPTPTLGSIRYWINAAAGTTEPAPTGSITGIDNAAWVGVKIASLGLASPAPAFSTAHHGQATLFDAFDSRRQTYIGH